jgi:hypothetical protein
LFENVRIALVFSAGEIAWGGFPAKVAVNALTIDVEFARYVFGIFVFSVSHGNQWIRCSFDALEGPAMQSDFSRTCRSSFALVNSTIGI